MDEYIKRSDALAVVKDKYPMAYEKIRTLPAADVRPVPKPHGRLIDADKMVKSIKVQVELLRMLGSVDPMLIELADSIESGYLQEIANAPTIIPAEEDRHES